MGKDSIDPPTFYSPIGERIKRWWKNLERYGFEISIAEFENKSVEYKNYENIPDDDFFVGDQFVKVNPEDIDFVEEGDASLSGHCIVHLKSGYILSGNWHKGQRKGPGIINGPPLEARGIKAVWGNYKNGVLTGKGGVELIDKEETILDGEFVNGKLHGNVRGFSNRVGLTSVSMFHEGRRIGPCWKALHGGSFLYGFDGVECDGRFSGDNVAYIYPDFETVLLGKFFRDEMQEAKESKVIGYFAENGLLRLEFAKPRGDIFRYWPSKWNEVVCPHLQEDPFEKKVIEARTSSVAGAGDGLFARVDIPANTACAFYNGIRVKPGEPEPYPCNGYQIYVDWNKQNRITSDYMDIPPDLVSLSRYRASLGHKVNHSFEPNCRWGTIDHPTFGHVPRIVTLRDIPAGTEITTHYKLDMEDAEENEHSKWYVDLWEKFSLKNLDSVSQYERKRHVESKGVKIDNQIDEVIPRECENNKV